MRRTSGSVVGVDEARRRGGARWKADGAEREGGNDELPLARGRLGGAAVRRPIAREGRMSTSARERGREKLTSMKLRPNLGVSGPDHCCCCPCACCWCCFQLFSLALGVRSGSSSCPCRACSPPAALSLLAIPSTLGSPSLSPLITSLLSPSSLSHSIPLTFSLNNSSTTPLTCSTSSCSSSRP